MSEFTRTAIFVAAAVAALALAVVTRPAAVELGLGEEIDSKLFPEFEDLRSAAAVEITQYDEVSGRIVRLTLARRDGMWRLSDYHDYPAAARQRIQQALASLADLKVIDVVTDNVAEQATHGVVTPEPGKTRLGASGVGRQVVVKDSTGQVLADLVIGQAVKDRPTQRYVRLPGRDRIYEVKLNADLYSPRMQDWVSENLLELERAAIVGLSVLDYELTAQTPPNRAAGEPSLAITRHGVIAASRRAGQHSDSQRRVSWQLERITQFHRRGAINWLLPGERLSGQALERAAVAATRLRAAGVMPRRQSPEDERELLNRWGFATTTRLAAAWARTGDVLAFAASASQAALPLGRDLLGSAGELVVHTAGGVDYRIRFGAVIDYRDPLLQTLAPKRVIAVSAELNAPWLARIEEPAERRQAYEQAVQRVAELNHRFDAWLYLLDDAAQQQLRLQIWDVIAAAPSTLQDGYGPAALRRLEQTPLERREKP